jgi:hypothetical protein
VGAGAVDLTRPPAEPTTAETSSISVGAGLEQLGRSADSQTVQLPRDPARAGCYENGATLGEAGPTITVTYRVDEVATYPARDFPAAKVNGPTSASTLRLVTCGGPLRPQLGHAVVNGHQTSVHR